jgi:hypothetical protein
MTEISAKDLRRLLNSGQASLTDKGKILMHGPINNITPPEKPVNKKIKGAKKVEYNGILFDSELELAFYQNLKAHQIPFIHQKKYVIIPKFKYRGKTIQGISITLDYVFKDIGLIIDTKGYPNEKFPLKMKILKYMFLRQGKEPVMWYVRIKRQFPEVTSLILDAFAGKGLPDRPDLYDPPEWKQKHNYSKFK